MPKSLEDWIKSEFNFGSKGQLCVYHDYDRDGGEMWNDPRLVSPARVKEENLFGDLDDYRLYQAQLGCRACRAHNKKYGNKFWPQELVDAHEAEVKRRADEHAARVEARKKSEDNGNVLSALDERLEHHDWTYHYSDDIRYWHAGEASMKRILELLGRAKAEGKLDEAHKLWAKHCPKSEGGGLFIQFPNV